MREKTPYKEAMRYIDNARKILSNHAGKDGDRYTDSKYVKMACNTAYSGVLLALDYRFGMHKKKKKGQRLDVDDYRKELKAINTKILSSFNEAYNLLHLSGGYDGSLLVVVSQSGIAEALKIVEWTKPYTDKEV